MPLAVLIKSRRQRGGRQVAVSRLYAHLWYLEHGIPSSGEQRAGSVISTQEREEVSREWVMGAIRRQQARGGQLRSDDPGFPWDR